MKKKEDYEIRIKPANKNIFLEINELWHYRELLYIFAWRDIKVRYKQTILGVGWALIQPITSASVFTIFFGKIAQISSDELPYPLFVLTGLVFWNFFSGILNKASGSLVNNEGIIKKIYFPRLIFPLSSIAINLADFVVSFVLLLMIVFYFGYFPSIWSLIIVPLGLLIIAVGAGGIGLFTSALNVRYRDVGYVLPFFIQLLIFLTPVIYPLSIVGHGKQLIIAVNPVAGAIESVRKVITNTGIVDFQLLLISSFSAIFLFITGLFYFRATEKFFADII